MPRWVRACGLDELRAAGALAVKLQQNRRVALFWQDGAPWAIANVCAHRCATLLLGCGTAARITCPYHAWVYRLDGHLVAAPYMHRTVDADGRSFKTSDHHLQRLLLEVWEGFVYVNADPAALPLGPRLEGLSAVVGRYQMSTSSSRTVRLL